MSGGGHEGRVAGGARRARRSAPGSGGRERTSEGPPEGPVSSEPPPLPPLGEPLVRRDPTPVPSNGDPWLGRVISGRYRVVGKLGSGGMGEVYEAEHLTLGKNVALKIIRPELAADEDLAARFAREALASARVEHPRMAMAIDYGPLPEGGAYLVLQRARGRSLLSVLRENGPLSWQQAAEVGAQVADALAAAHGAGIVHRDLKPENLLLDLQPDGDMVVWVLDLGIARVEQPPSGPARPGLTPEPLTRVGEVMGTPGYMSPEQAMGEPASPEADFYALGVVLWEMVAGRRLFPGDNLPDILTVQLTDSVPILSLLRPESEVPPGLDDVVQWLLSRRPDTRPHKATLVRDALRSLLGPRDIEWPVPIFGKGWAPRGELHGRRPSAAPTSSPPTPPPARIDSARATSPLPGPELARSSQPGPTLPHPSATPASTAPPHALSASALRAPAPVVGTVPSSAPPSSGPSWIPPSVLPEPARRQLPAVLLAFGVIAPLVLVGTVALLVRMLVPALVPPAAPAPPTPTVDAAPVVTATPAPPATVTPAEAPAEPPTRAEAAEPATAALEPAAPEATVDAARARRLPEEITRRSEALLGSGSRSVRRRAARFLLDDARADDVPAHVRAVARLEVARGCRGHRAALADIAEAGDRSALPAVRRLSRTPRTGCGAFRLDDCIGCLRAPIRRTLRALAD